MLLAGAEISRRTISGDFNLDLHLLIVGYLRRLGNYSSHGLLKLSFAISLLDRRVNLRL
jgi:hypothetical protein